MTQQLPSTSEEVAKRGPGRPRKAADSAADSADGIALRCVYFAHAWDADYVDPWAKGLSWASTVKPSATGVVSNSLGFDSIVLIGGHTVRCSKNGKSILMPWTSCKNAIESADSDQ